MVRKAFFVTISVCLASFSSHAQVDEKGNSHALSIQELQEIYSMSAGKDKSYINGSLYTEGFPGSRGNPFFHTETWQTGAVYMKGQSYDSLLFRYDLYRDQLLYNHIHTTGSYILVLNKTRIDSFTIDGHHFHKLSVSGEASPEGFYELLAEGRATFYVKWFKRLSEPSPESSGDFSLFSEWYILKNGRFSKVSGRSGLLKALGDKDKEIKSYIRKNKMVVRPGNEMAIKSIVDYYNHLEP